MKKIIGIFLIFLLLRPQPVWAFSDTEDLWCEEVIDLGVQAGYWVGEGETFAPQRMATRAEAVAIFYRMAQGEGAAAPFSDVPEGAWYAQAMGWAAQSGILAGEGGQALPQQPIRREELWTMAGRFVGAEETDVWQVASDGALLSPWAKAGTGWCLRQHLISENDFACLYPQQTMTRGELAVFFWQFGQRLQNQANTR